MAISTGELINVINRWEKEIDRLKGFKNSNSDRISACKVYDAKIETLQYAIKELEKVIAASMRCGISF